MKIMKKITNSRQAEKQFTPPIGENTFATTDLGIAAALLTADFELLNLDKSDPHKVKFVFSRGDGITKVADDFWSNRLEQKVRSFWDNVKVLKNRLYSNE